MRLILLLASLVGSSASAGDRGFWFEVKLSQSIQETDAEKQKALTKYLGLVTDYLKSIGCENITQGSNGIDGVRSKSIDVYLNSTNCMAPITKDVSAKGKGTYSLSIECKSDEETFYLSDETDVQNKPNTLPKPPAEFNLIDPNDEHYLRICKKKSSNKAKVSSPCIQGNQKLIPSDSIKETIELLKKK